MAKKFKQKQLPTQGEIIASTRRPEALRSGRKFTDKKRQSKSDKTGRKSKYGNID